MVLGCEVGGRWSEESRQFLAGLAATKARSEPEVMRKSTMHSWLRWSTLMACTAARAFALALLERRCCTSADGHSNDGRGQGLRLEAIGLVSFNRLVTQSEFCFLPKKGVSGVLGVSSVLGVSGVQVC